MDKRLIKHLARGLLKERVHRARQHNGWQPGVPGLVDHRERQYEHIFWELQGSNGQEPQITVAEKQEVRRWLLSCLRDAVTVLKARCGNRTVLQSDVNELLKVCKGTRQLIDDFFQRARQSPNRNEVETLKELVQKRLDS